MDGTRFDALTRELASGASRRTLLKGIAVGLVAAVIGRDGSVAAARQANGATCSRATDCASFRCVDGVCCDSACTGQCEACTVPGSEGTCVPITGPPRGNRPACPGSGPCAAVCDGQTRSQCAAFPGADVACGESSCVNGSQTTFTCTGNGACAPETSSCDLFVCDAAGIACLTTCQSNDDCIGQAHCANGVCQGDSGLGESCVAADECQSGFCAGNVCCIEACDEPCHACSTGFCEPVADDTTCDGGLCCDGGCIDPTTNLEHCGGCDAGCVGGHICVNSACACPDGTTECNGFCAPDCPGDQVLDLGTCQCVCPGADVPCGADCVPPCADGKELNAACQCVCAADTAACPDGSCVDTGTNEHCLACNDACGPLEVCSSLGTGCCTQVGQVCDPANDDCCRSPSGTGGCVSFNGGTICCDALSLSPCHPECEPDGPCAACCSNFCGSDNRCDNPPTCSAGQTLCGGACVDDCLSGQTLNSTTCLCEVNTCTAENDECSGDTPAGNAECCSGVCGCAFGFCFCRDEQCAAPGQPCGFNNSQCCAGVCVIGDTGVCSCPIGQVPCGNDCIEFCPTGQTLNLNSCACECPAGQTLCEGACVTNCPAGHILNPETCVCEVSTCKAEGETCSGATDAGNAECCSGGCGCDGAECTCQQSSCEPLGGSDCDDFFRGCCAGVCFDNPPPFTPDRICVCGDGTTQCNGRCLPDCSDGQTLNPNTCACEQIACVATGDTCTVGGAPCCDTGAVCVDIPIISFDPICICPPGFDACDGACVNRDADEEHCGTCGTQCESDETCCFGQCVTLGNDPEHCGNCGVSCGEDHICTVGACCGFAGTSCQVDNDCCGSIQACCDNVCTVITSAEDHCGACNTACDPDQICFQSLCCVEDGSACQTAEDCCGLSVCTANQCQ